MAIKFFSICIFLYIWTFRDSFKAAFHLQKIFRGQERNGKVSSDRNGKFSVVNFHFFFWRFISNQKVNKDGQIKHNNKKMVHETTNVIWDVLMQDYLPCPATEHEWKDVSQKF